MDILDCLQKRIIEISSSINSQDFVLHGLWGIDLLFQPNIEERVFQYKLILSQTKKQGCAYCVYDSNNFDEKLIGKDSRYVDTNNRCLRIAVLDAAYSCLPNHANQYFQIEGDSYQKSKLRADIVVNEIDRILNQKKKGGKCILNIGVVGNIINELINRNYEVRATDLDNKIIGTLCHGVEIQNGIEFNDELIAKCDLALVTGMTLSTNTLDKILQNCRSHKTKVVIFAETGAWFGKEYCELFGVDAVICEPFPFYIFEGTSNIHIHRKRK